MHKAVQTKGKRAILGSRRLAQPHSPLFTPVFRALFIMTLGANTNLHINARQCARYTRGCLIWSQRGRCSVFQTDPLAPPFAMLPLPQGALVSAQTLMARLKSCLRRLDVRSADDYDDVEYTAAATATAAACSALSQARLKFFELDCTASVALSTSNACRFIAHAHRVCSLFANLQSSYALRA